MQTKEVLPLVFATLITAGCQRERQLPQQTAKQAAPIPAETPTHQQENLTLKLQALVNENAKKLCGEGYIGQFLLRITPWEGEGNGVYKVLISHEHCPTQMQAEVLNNIDDFVDKAFSNLMFTVNQHIQYQHRECLGRGTQITRQLTNKPNIPPPLKPSQTRPYFNKT